MTHAHSKHPEPHHILFDDMSEDYKYQLWTSNPHLTYEQAMHILQKGFLAGSCIPFKRINGVTAREVICHLDGVVVREVYQEFPNGSTSKTS